MKQNEGSIDRIARVFLSMILFIAGFFWVGGIAQIVLYALSTLMLFTGIIGFCPLYIVFKFNTLNFKEPSTTLKVVLAILFLFVAIGGSYLSAFFTRKIFLDDYNSMNNYYKQTLFYTGQNKREESVRNYDLLVGEFGKFSNKYSNYHPYVIKFDKQFNKDIESVSTKINNLKDTINNGDLPSAHTELEVVRPVFQDILKRNGFSLLQVYLVDFHDAMEKVLDPANEKNSEEVVLNYQEASDKLKAVEEVANDAEISLIRQNLEDLLTLAKNNQTDKLPSKASELKSSFVKVYLKRG